MKFRVGDKNRRTEKGRESEGEMNILISKYMPVDTHAHTHTRLRTRQIDAISGFWFLYKSA